MAFRNLWQRKTRSLLTILGLAAAVMLYMYMTAISLWYDQDLQHQLAGFAGKVAVLPRSDAMVRFPNLSSVIPAAAAEAALQVPGLDAQRSSAVLLQQVVANPAPNMPPLVTAVGLTPGHEFAFTGNAAVNGAGHLQGPDEAILGAKAAAHYGVATGDSVTLQEHSFRVAGVLAAGNELLDGAVIMPLDTMQSLFVRPGVVSSVLVTAIDPGRVAELGQAIEAATDKVRAVTSTQMAEAVSQMMVQQRAFFSGIQATVLFVSVIMVTIVMVMAVSERRREIGTLKALGAGARHILGQIAAEAVLLSLAGSVVAVPVYYLRGSAHFNPTLVLQTTAVAVAVGVFAALWPAWSAQRVDPLESLRSE